MRAMNFTTNDRRKLIHWPALFAAVAAVHAMVIGAVEGFWYLFTGGFSPLMGGFALVVANLIAVRMVGGRLSMRTRTLQSPLEEW